MTRSDKAERELTEALQRIYRRYGNDLDAFFRDVKSRIPDPAPGEHACRCGRVGCCRPILDCNCGASQIVDCMCAHRPAAPQPPQSEQVTTWPSSTCAECGKPMESGRSHKCVHGGLCSWYVPRAALQRISALEREIELRVQQASALNEDKERFKRERDELARKVDPFSRFWDEQSDWSQLTFGPDCERGPIGPLKHLVKEAKEAQDSPTDLSEFVDCLFLVIDATRRAGFSKESLLVAAFDKLAVNRARSWPDWRSAPADEAIEHDRSTPQGDPQ